MVENWSLISRGWEYPRRGRKKEESNQGSWQGWQATACIFSWRENRKEREALCSSTPFYARHEEYEEEEEGEEEEGEEKKEKEEVESKRDEQEAEEGEEKAKKKKEKQKKEAASEQLWM